MDADRGNPKRVRRTRDIDGMKTCTRCFDVKALSDFGAFKASRDGLKSECKSCANNRSKEYRVANAQLISDRDKKYRADNIDTIKERKKRYNDQNKDSNSIRCKAYREIPENKSKIAKSRIHKKYGLDLIQYHTLLAFQAGCCAICKVKFGDEKTTRGHVDHSHATGKVRGLLCMNCNQALGKMRDNPETLRSAADYLERCGFSCDALSLPIAVQK